MQDFGRGAPQGDCTKVRGARLGYVRIFFGCILLAVTFVLAEVSFRMYDYVTVPQDTLNQDVWIKQVSGEVEEHELLGYRYPPGKAIDDTSRADKFGMRNAGEVLEWGNVEVVGVGDSYMDAAHRIFFEQFKSRGIRYHSLAMFGYGPANYNILLRDYGPQLSPKVYVYSVYLGNDPGDIRRYEAWRASGKSWFDFNGGYLFPIERQGPIWGWHLFMGRAKSYATTLMGRINPGAYEALRGIIRKDNAETIFQYILIAKTLAKAQGVPLIVIIVPRTAGHKPLLDPVAEKLRRLCDEQQIDCLDLDPAFGPSEGRERLFAPDEHWNDAGMQVVWEYMWNERLKVYFRDTEDRR